MNSNKMFKVNICCLVVLCGIALAQTIVWQPNAPDISISYMKTNIDIASNLASTLVEIHFYNNGSRQGEGELVFPLPQGVSVSRYALDINGEFREAVPVPKDKGTQVFEALQNVRVDPGLLQKTDDGNSFKTRVFPIPGGGTRKVLIGYQQELNLNDRDELSYQMVSSYAKPIGNFTIALSISSDSKPVCIDDRSRRALPLSFGNGVYSYTANVLNDVPTSSFSISIPTAANASQVVTKDDGDNYFYAFVKLKDLARPPQPKPAKARLAIIWDNSLSCANRDINKEL
jgi:hypothetical protein